MKHKLNIQLLILLIGSSTLLAADWPRFLGPNGDSISPETNINKTWLTTPPKELWRLPLSDEGFSGPAVVGAIVYVHDHVEDQDVIRALDIVTGEEKWQFKYTEPGRENDGFTRATPTIEEGKVYTISRTGVVHCLDATTGKKIWRSDAMEDHGGKPPKWGAANSAYIHGDHLITIAAGEDKHVVALNKKTGEPVWAGGGTDLAGYGTPVHAVIDNKDLYLVFTGQSFIGVDSSNGQLLWRHPWKTRLDSNAAAPIVLDKNHIWIASGYRRGCALLNITDGEIKEVWAEKRITPHWSSAVLHQGFIYTTTPPGYLVCVEAMTGKEQWRSKGTARGFEHGGLCAIDGTLIVIEGNTGNVVQVALQKNEYQELGRISPFKSARCWTAPIIAHKKLLVRSPEELVCLDIRKLQ